MNGFFESNQKWFWPKKIEWLVFIAIVGLYMFGAAFVLNGDGSYGYAMIEKIHDPAAFASNDLAVNGSDNFLFYRTLSLLPFFEKNFVLWDMVISSFFSVILLLAWYNVFLQFVKNKLIIWISFFILLFSDGRFSMGGSTIPLFYLSSIVSVLYLQVISFWLFINKKYLVCFGILSLTTYFHPASGLFFIIVLLAALLIQSVEKKEYVQFLKASIVSLLIFIPNLLLISRNLLAHVNTKEFFNLFYLFNCGHAFPQDYWFGYVFTALTIALFYLFHINKKIDLNNLNFIFKIIAIIVLLVAGWLINLFFIKNLQIFYLYFAMRSAYVLKPFLALFLGSIIYSLIQDKSFISKIEVVLIILAALFVPQLWSGLPLAAVLFIELFKYKYNIADKFIFEKMSYFFAKINIKKLFFIICLLVILVVAWFFGNKFNNKWAKVWNLLNGTNQFNYSFDSSKNFGISNSNKDFSDLIDWSKQFKGKMFIIPPTDCYMNAFRFLTKNSLYINACEMSQLSYIPDYFMLGNKRLEKIGLTIISRGKFSNKKYYQFDLRFFKELREADFIVFDKKSEFYSQKIDKSEFENGRYIIYSLK